MCTRRCRGTLTILIRGTQLLHVTHVKHSYGVQNEFSVLMLMEYIRSKLGKMHQK